MPQQSFLLDLAIRAARAGAVELSAWRGKFQAREKSPCDLVTEADLASERAIQAVILEEFPDHAILGEESGAAPADRGRLLEREFCWVVDPLDGTTNYVHGFPCYGVSIAAVCRGELEAAVVFDPVADELFAATVGGGATLNGQPITGSDVSEIPQSLVAVSFPPATKPTSPDMEAFARAALQCQAVRRTGSAALNLAYVACGRLDAHWAHQIHPWDAAAGVLLVREAGGRATASDGRPFDLARANYFAAGNGALHSKLLPVVAGNSE